MDCNRYYRKPVIDIGGHTTVGKHEYPQHCSLLVVMGKRNIRGYSSTTSRRPRHPISVCLRKIVKNNLGAYNSELL